MVALALAGLMVTGDGEWDQPLSTWIAVPTEADVEQNNSRSIAAVNPF